MVNKNKEYLTIPELAKIIGISRIAVYKKIKNGDIDAIKIGKIYAIPKNVLGEIFGTTLSDKHKKIIDSAVKKTIKDYGKALELLGNE